MKKFYIVFLISFVLILLGTSIVLADNENIIDLSDDEIKINGEKITNDVNNVVYVSNKMDNGGTSNDSSKNNIEIDSIINIIAPGTYEFSGTLNNGQIAVNANNINGTVNIILNSVSITCNDAPAIFIYSKSVENENCKVTIKTKKDTVNTITGGKIKQSVQGLQEQENILYYIEKGYDDDKQYYERYKYDGAISSDISLEFQGEGILNVKSTKKEGIESKMNITFNGGTYNIDSCDDGINASSDGKSAITINEGTIIVKVSKDTEEGDGIDSNGTITINGGTVYTFACPGSDNGLDSDLGTYINGGKVFATGSMYEEVKTSNNTKIVQMSLSKEVNAEETILIVDENEKVVFAYKADRKISTLVYANNLEDKNYSVYTGSGVKGTTDANGIYTNIDSFDLTKMTKQENTGIGRFNPNQKKNDTNIINLGIQGNVILGILIAILIFSVIMFIYDYRKNK